MKDLKMLLFAAATVFATSSALAENEIVFAPATTSIEVNQGEHFDIQFNLTNTVKCTTFQWWLIAPEGLDMVYDEEEEAYAVDFGSRLSANYATTAEYKKDSRDFLVLSYNMTGKKLMPLGEGLFCTMTLKADIAPGTYEIAISKANFNWSGETDIETVRPEDTTITVTVKGESTPDPDPTPDPDQNIVFAPAVKNISVKQGETFELPFNLTNKVQCTAFQWWVKAEDGINVVYNEAEEEYAVDFGNRLTDNYSITAEYKVGSHDFLVLPFNATGKKLMPLGEGLFCTMTFKADVAPGTYQIVVDDINFNWDGEDDVETAYPESAVITLTVTADEGTPDPDPQPVGEIVFAPVSTDIEATIGEPFELKFNLTNEVQPNTFQWWVIAPEGIEVASEMVDDELEYKVDFGSRLTSNYSVTTDYKRGSHDFLVLAFNSTGKKPMPMTEGLFCTMTMMVDEAVAPGNYTININECNFNWDNGSGVSTATIPDMIINLTVVEGSGIENVRVDGINGDAIYYDLMGRRVEHPTTGIYIVNGQKVYVK